MILFGATGMIGQGVLRECLLAPDVERVVVVGRAPTGQRHDKLREVVHRDFTDFSGIGTELSGLDACFFCLGVSAAGQSESEYRRVTYEYPLAAARALAQRNPELTFVYVSGQGTNPDGRAMWARVKGEAENALLAMPLRAYMLRPGFIQPLHGARSRTRGYRLLYLAAAPLLPLLRRLFPSQITTTEQIGAAMLQLARHGAAEQVLAPPAINALKGP